MTFKNYLSFENFIFSSFDLLSHLSIGDSPASVRDRGGVSAPTRVAAAATAADVVSVVGVPYGNGGGVGGGASRCTADDGDPHASASGSL